MSKKNIIKHTLSMGFATYVSQSVGTVTSIAMRAYLGPTAMGTWTMLQVVLGYCGYASFGTTRAMTRDYSILRGKGENEKAEKIRDLTMTFSMLMSFIPAVIILVCTLWQWHHLEASLRIGFLFLTVFLFLQRFYDIVISLLSSDQLFGILSDVTILNAVGMLAVVLFLVRPFGIYGMFLGVALITGGSLAYIYKKKFYEFKFYWNNRELWNQLRLGLPLISITFLSTFFQSLDKLIIAKYLGLKEVGFYSIAMMIATLVYAIPMAFVHVIFRHTLVKYGKHEDPASIRSHLLKPVMLLSFLVPFICGISIYAAPPLVIWFLPKFVSGLLPMKIFLMGTFFFLIARIASQVLTTLDRYWIRFPILALASLLNVGLNFLFIHLGWGLLGVAWGTTLSYIAYGYLTFGVTERIFTNWRSVGFHLGKITLLLSVLFGGVFVIDRLSWMGSGVANFFSKTALLIVFFAPFIWRMEKQERILAEVWAAIRKRSAPPLAEDDVLSEGEG